MAIDKQFLESLQTEVDASYLYEKIGALEKNPDIAKLFLSLSQAEQHHVDAFKAKMVREGSPAPETKPSGRARFLVWLATKFGSQLVMPILIQTEKSIAVALKYQKEKNGVPSDGRENAHTFILEQLSKNTGSGVEGGLISKLEGRHKSVGGNALRAAVLGANDGLVSNLSLVMGVDGAITDNKAILITGLAGLLAGAISMALGEWLSVQSSRELYERQIRIEAEELESSPEEEARELMLIYQAKGIPEATAREMAQKLISNPATALDTLAREELAIDPEELGGSAWEAAITSFILFSIGAIIPVIPHFFLTGNQATLVSLGVSSVGLFGIGAAITLLTGKGVLYSGIRQMIFGLAAAAVTYGIGYLMGVSMGG